MRISVFLAVLLILDTGTRFFEDKYKKFCLISIPLKIVPRFSTIVPLIDVLTIDVLYLGIQDERNTVHNIL